MNEQNAIMSFPDNLIIVEGKNLLSSRHLLVPPHLEVIIRNPRNAAHLQDILSEEYPVDHPLEIFMDVPENQQNLLTIKLAELSQQDHYLEKALWIRIPPLPESRSFEYFQNIVAILRAPNGCPWDRKQTHQSLRDDFLQEAYELLEGLDRNDIEMISEELGDVLLHIVMQAQIAQENNEFNMGDVLAKISEKLIFRHEHVFGNPEKLSSDQVLNRWEKVKNLEREKDHKEQGLLDGISKAMPALSMAYSYQKRAARVGFDWESIDGVWDKLYEEIEEFKRANTPEERAEELGDILFTLVNLARWSKIDPETALRNSNLKFHDRVQYVETKARELGKNLFDMPMSEKDQYWDEYKES